MERTDKFMYYVIHFLELPYPDIDEYVCVPRSWIVLRREMDKQVIVSYPVENPSETAKRAKKRHERSDDWKFYLSVEKCGFDLYEDAEIFINENNNDVYFENKRSNLKDGDKKISVPVKIKSDRNKQYSKSNHEIDKSLDLVITSKNDDKSATKRLKQTTLPRPDTEAALKLPKVVEPTESVSDAAEQPSQASECLSGNQPLPTREVFPIQKSRSLEIVVEESNGRSCVEEIEHVENSEQERPSVIQNSPNLTNSLSNPKPMLDPLFFTELFAVLRNLHTVSANSYTLVHNLSRVIIDNTETMKDAKQLIVDSRSLNSDIPTTPPSTNTTAEVEKISENNKRKQKQRDEEDDDYDDDDDEVPKKKRFQKPKFVLPQEYDENDSRWTLKHREMAPGVVELMPHSNVYINALKLSNCKRLSKDCKSLARMLLVEIFTKNALTICTLTGSRARAYDVEGATIRPGLDENARTVLLTYVEEYGRKKGWITLDTQAIQNSIRNKMQEFRFKYG